MRLSTLKSIFHTPRQAAILQAGTIVIGNSYCQLKGFPIEAVDIVRSRLTYDNQEVIYEVQQLKVSLAMAFRYKKLQKVRWMKARIAELEQRIEICWLKGDQFPTGHLKLVQETLEEHKAPYSIEDRRRNRVAKVKLPWAHTLPEPRYFQKDMLELGLKEHRGVFESAVGSGKTYIMQLLAHHIATPTLVIVPSKDLGVQTFDSFTHAFGKKNVELIGAGAKIVQKKPIRICTVQTLAAAQKKGRDLKNLLDGIGMLCIDEVHHAGAQSYTNLLPQFDHIYYRFGFSGTFMRNDSRTLDMWGFLSTVLYKYSAAQATREGYLTPLKVLVHEVTGSKGTTYQREYNANYCSNPELLVSLKRLFENFISDDDQVLILVGRKDKSGKIIHEFLDELGIHSAYVSGDSKRDDVKQALADFNAKRVKVLVGSSIIGEGIDVRSTDHLIMAQGGKSEIAITQALGRAARLFPGKEVAWIHDFRFLGTKYLEKHLEQRLEIYRRNFDGEIVC